MSAATEVVLVIGIWFRLRYNRTGVIMTYLCGEYISNCNTASNCILTVLFYSA